MNPCLFSRGYSKEYILSSRKAHTRGNLDSEILYNVENPEILVRRRRGKEQLSTSHTERSLFQNQEEYFSFRDLDLEINVERYLLRSKS